MRFLATALGFTIGTWLAAPVLAQMPAKTDKVDIVAVTGCLRESPPNTWTLANATDPVASSANAPSAKDIAAAPRTGKNEFRLIGVAEFNLPAHRDHLVIVKGLHVKAMPISRLNVTSVTMVAPSCDAAAKGAGGLH